MQDPGRYGLDRFDACLKVGQADLARRAVAGMVARNAGDTLRMPAWQFLNVAPPGEARLWLELDVLGQPELKDWLGKENMAALKGVLTELKRLERAAKAKAKAKKDAAKQGTSAAEAVAAIFGDGHGGNAPGSWRSEAGEQATDMSDDDDESEQGSETGEEFM